MVFLDSSKPRIWKYKVVMYCFQVFAVAMAHQVFIVSATAADEVIEFGKHISPLLADNCFECHGPDAENRQAGLRLDLRADALAPLASGGFAIVPGDVSASKLIQVITSHDPDLRMPPKDSNKSLTPSQIEQLKGWVKQGADWKKHWSFELPLRRPAPQVTNTAWPKNDIDRYILARLESAGLSPAPQADKRTLIRRATLDLIGLPPTPEEVDAFLADNSTDAFAKVIDRLLASPHYGERWARHWLDVTRYADSNGADENRPHPYAYQHRNYVIDAFNRDLPYDEFVREQIAGDLLPQSEDLDVQFNRIAATGFLAMGVKILAEQDPVKKQADIVDEQIDTMGKTFLGLTLGCARCHDHKFDPIPTRDYYALAGIFHSTNITDRKVATIDYQQSRKSHDKKIEGLSNKLEAENKNLNSFLSDVPDTDILEREAESFDRGNILIDKDSYGVGIGVINSSANEGNEFEYDISLKQTGKFLVQFRYAAQTVRPCQLFINGTLAKANALGETTGGWYPPNQKWSVEGVYELQAGINQLRLTSKTMAHIDKLRLVYIDGNDEINTSVNALDRLRKKLDELANQAPTEPTLMAVNDGKVQDVRIHHRGSHNMLGDVEPRHFLSISKADESVSLPKDQSGRLELANWLVRPDHPLTARVIVNRVWGWHFGKGIVSTPDNFGIMGARPTHPLLLDYLALRLVDDGWSLKKLHRLIMLSSTYQMSAVNAVTNETDPDNILYWKREERRLEAEAIRDGMLSLAGQLDRTIGGPPIEGVKSINLSVDEMAKNFAAYEGSTRRSIYLPIIRTAIYDKLTLFDFPNSNNPVGRRAVTTVPTQALMMMNSDFVTKQAELIVSQLIDKNNLHSREQIVNQLYLMLFIRPATASELVQALEFLDEFSKLPNSANTTDDPLRAALNSLCHTFLMSNDFLYIQ
tara:strand:+ start:1930 stop:4704 length:2775 start_codon:yes stop_codon:yes gene_type:complete